MISGSFNLDGDMILAETIGRLGIDLGALVAATGIWANPDVFKLLKIENTFGVWYQNVRRAAQKRGEKKGEEINGVRMDDNTYANFAIEGAIGKVRQTSNVEVCHIWPRSTYDERYHTCIANLVLLPRSVAGLSDKHPPVVAALQHRAFVLYGWYPADIGGVPVRPPEKPPSYPTKWRDPEAMTPAIEQAIGRRKPR
jgi:hypothetical protein